MRRGFDVSRETLEKLEIYAELLKKWNPKINLVSNSTLDDLWERHFLDSAQLLTLSQFPIEHWVDFGSGGGFPGMVIGILNAEAKRNVKLTLVESDQRKVAFLRQVARELSVAATIKSKRIEELPSLEADLISARALAPLPKLFSLSEGHLKKGGIMLFPKGENWKTEVEEAQSKWCFDYDIAKSKTADKSVILRVSGVRRA